ncbi:lycopene cyclase domain-containing protein [Lysobacter korlensis]|uniref:Lycopene cyclase domain-containing protein n=1 Tax=Lysobacter korlensis TaxID=553636 RepID=A0ABV6RTU2_9GAMM
MTYLALNAVFLLVVGVVVVLAVLRSRGRGGGIRWRPLAIAAGALLLLTAVFDNVMIAVGLVGYDADRISGLRVGVAPIEDFAYAIAAVLLLPAIWHLTVRVPLPAAPDPAAQDQDAQGLDA